MTGECKFIFITGGVVSSLGKGLASASLAALLQARGYKVKIRKLDPYLNVDPGTMNPIQHGEVFVTDDGTETDLDLGHYERLTEVQSGRLDNVTAGKIYSELLRKERKGDYLGATVQVIPHVTNLIKEFIKNDTAGLDFLICEIGGTIGDIEGLPFYEAARQLSYDLGLNKNGNKRTIFIHLTLIPYIKTAKELKTKPTQHSVKELRTIGIQPDILLCRSEYNIPQLEREKIALFCNVNKASVIQAIDQNSIYEVPLRLSEEGLDERVLAEFNISSSQKPNLSKWLDINEKVKNLKKKVTVAIVGKYVSLSDAYKSLLEAIDHAGINNNTRVEIKWVNSKTLNQENVATKLADIDGIIVPGGFGESGVEGKIFATQYAREKKIPYLGICFGMQLAVIEFARNVVGIKDATSAEFGEAENPIVGLMQQWFSKDGLNIRVKNNDLGGSMRLGGYECVLKKGSKIAKIYGKSEIRERHRHRYEVNINYKDRLEAKGMIFSGLSPDGKLPEVIELKDHPWFIGVQFHPEFTSTPFNPSPLFNDFVKHL
ncbi:MAG: CTP synthase [Alphaproteobacteria bacterium]|jgi:CTP synthase